MEPNGNEILAILSKHRKYRGSLEYVSYMAKYWKDCGVKPTKFMLRAYDFPFSPKEFELLAKWLEESK